jgi:hypothetical protein
MTQTKGTASVQEINGGPLPGIGDTVRIYHRERCNGEIVRTLQRGEYVIARENRHGDWTVRDSVYGTTHDVFRADVEAAG